MQGKLPQKKRIYVCACARGGVLLEMRMRLLSRLFRESSDFKTFDSDLPEESRKFSTQTNFQKKDNDQSKGRCQLFA